MELKHKPYFIEKYKELLKEDFDEFLEYSNKYSRKAIRVNTLKIDIDSLKDRMGVNWELIPVPWCKEGFWIKYKDGVRWDIGNTPEHQLGYIYVQDPASMIPAVVLNPKEDELVLDMCAAPGSKTSQLAQYMNNTGLLIANDRDGKRLGALGINLQRCGVYNAIITKMNGERIKNAEFDKILLDAPCSGTGTIRKNQKITEMYSENLVKRMAGIQWTLIKKAFQLLKKDGVLVYSTCTLEPEENEKIVSKLLEKHPDAVLETIDLDIKKTNPITSFRGESFNPDVVKCLRINPQSNDTEGFFVAKIRKK